MFIQLWRFPHVVMMYVSYTKKAAVHISTLTVLDCIDPDRTGRLLASPSEGCHTREKLYSFLITESGRVAEPY